MKIARFEDIEAWKEARLLVSMVYESTGKEPFKRDWGLKDQLIVDSYSHIPQELSFNSDFEGSFIHPFVIGKDKSYSLSRISRINFVESTSNILSFSMYLFNSDKDSVLCFPNLNSSITECSSLSTRSNLFTINTSSISITNNNVGKRYINSFGLIFVKIARFEDIEAWKEARVLVSMVYESTGKEPFKRDWGLKKQLIVDSSKVKGVKEEGT